MIDRGLLLLAVYGFAAVLVGAALVNVYLADLPAHALTYR